MRYKIYTGPTMVKPTAERLRARKFVTDVFEGTEHVYITFMGTLPEVLDMLREGTKYPGWTLRDIHALREVEG